MVHYVHGKHGKLLSRHLWFAMLVNVEMLMCFDDQNGKFAFIRYEVCEVEPQWHLNQPHKWQTSSTHWYTDAICLHFLLQIVTLAYCVCVCVCVCRPYLMHSQMLNLISNDDCQMWPNTHTHTLSGCPL